MQKADLAIVVPTLNEQNYIGLLLDSVLRQTVLPQEIVVVDARSSDKTAAEIQERHRRCSFITLYVVPPSTISVQRNFGANRSRANDILFLDADVVLLSPDTLAKLLAEVRQRRPDIAAATNLPLSKDWRDWLYYFAIDAIFRLVKPIWPMAMGTNMYVNRQTLERLGGFDEGVRFAEDHEFVQRAVKRKARFLFLNTPKVFTSTRRLDVEGRWKYTLKMVRSLLWIWRVGYRKNPTPYTFGHFS
jgi:glycosyltransferase involved in cell wall biosynthesis